MLQPSSAALQPVPVPAVVNRSSSGPSSATGNNNNNNNISAKKPTSEVDQLPLFADDEKKSSKIQELRKLIESKFSTRVYELVFTTPAKIPVNDTVWHKSFSDH